MNHNNYLKNVQFLEFNDETQEYEHVNGYEFEEVLTDKNQLTIYANIPLYDNNDTKHVKIEIPMTPSNVDLLKEQIRLSDYTLQKESDNRGRINLGVDHGEKEVELSILEESDLDEEK